jgi:hypothetical protein
MKITEKSEFPQNCKLVKPSNICAPSPDQLAGMDPSLIYVFSPGPHYIYVNLYQLASNIDLIFFKIYSKEFYDSGQGGGGEFHPLNIIINKEST